MWLDRTLVMHPIREHICKEPVDNYIGAGNKDGSYEDGRMEDKKVLLSIKDLQVKFRVRGKRLTAIRGVSLDIYENESIAIAILTMAVLFLMMRTWRIQSSEKHQFLTGW